MGETFVVVTEESLKKDWIQEEFGWGNPISGGTPNRLFRCRIKVQ